ncbi:MAG: recombination regulator RecX [Azoarcus sp.]|jgi:regulatory protein|nr:recombination regulator RecX [Azoarcus sp.]
MTEPSLRQRALRHLARRDYSRAELTRKLAPHGEAEEIDAVLDRMSELTLQSDARLAKSWVRSHAGRFGRARLQSELTRRGLARALIEEALSGDDLASELDRARALRQTKFPDAPADTRERARQARFLHARGFAADIVRAVLAEEPEPESEPAQGEAS